MSLQHELFEWLRNNRVGDLHAHSNFSLCCKEITIQDLALKSEEQQIPITLTDHSSHLLLGTNRDLIYQADIPSETLTFLLKEYQQEGLQRYKNYIKHFKEQSSPFLRLGVELDVLEDGMLFFPPQLLPEMDFFIGHIPHLFAQKRNENLAAIMMEWRRRTEAIMIAGVDVVAHPFRVLCNKKILFDVAAEVQWLVEKATIHSTALEINAHNRFPEIDEAMVKMAILAGVKLAIGTDSHHPREILDFAYHSIILERSEVKADQLDGILYHGQSKRKVSFSSCMEFGCQNLP